jgi:hypothetical protein
MLGAGADGDGAGPEQGLLARTEHAARQALELGHHLLLKRRALRWRQRRDGDPGDF